MKPQISIIIRCFNEDKHIKSVLNLIKKQTITNYEIILVDSDSTDKTIFYAKPIVDKIINIKPENFSFGYALNKGIEASSGKFLVFLSAHCYPTNNNWLANLIEPFKDKKIACVYGKQRGGKTTTFSERQIFKKWYPNIDIKQKNPFSNNANIAIRNSLWKKYKYNESLTGLEDLDWANRVLNNEQMYIYYSAKAAVIHIHDEAISSIVKRYKREGISYSKIVPHDKFTIYNFMILCLSNILSDILCSIKEKKAKKSFINIIIFRFSQFLGTYIGRNFHKKITNELKNRFYYP